MAKNLKRHYQRHYKDDIYENLKRCTVLLVIRKKQIKTRMRYYYKGRITTTTRTTNKKPHSCQYHEPVNVKSNWKFHTLMVGMYSHFEKILLWLCLVIWSRSLTPCGLLRWIQKLPPCKNLCTNVCSSFMDNH